MKRSLRSMLLASALLACAAHAAQMVTEVIPIGYRTAEEILPIARSLVPPPGSVSGLYNQLVVKTTPENLRELKRVLAELDRPPRRLLISVHHGISGAFTGHEQEAFGSIESGDVRASVGPPRGRRGLVITHGEGDSKLGVRALSRHSTSADQDVQRIQVLEGREAFIQAGQSVPFPERRVIVQGNVTSVQDSVHYRDVGSGVYVVPRVNGDRVSLAISPRRSRLTGRGHGSIAVQQAQTTVSGRLGEWIEIGGVSEQGSRTDSGVAYSSRSQAAASQSIFVKVEALPQ